MKCRTEARTFARDCAAPLDHVTATTPKHRQVCGLPVVAIVIAILGTSLAQAATVTFALAKSRAVPGQELTSPMMLKGATGVGRMHVELVYDDRAFELKSIEPGSMLDRNCQIHADTSRPGRAVVDFVTAQPMSGDGEVLKALFVVRHDAPQIAHKLVLENVKVSAAPVRDLRDDAPQTEDLLVAVAPGEIRVIEPGVPIWIVGAILAVAVVVVLLSKKKKRDGSTTPA